MTMEYDVPQLAGYTSHEFETERYFREGCSCLKTKAASRRDSRSFVSNGFTPTSRNKS